MLRKNTITVIFIAFWIVGAAQYKKYSFQQPKMGSPFNIVIYSSDSASVAKAALDAFRMIDSLNEIYSDYIATSELNQLCSTAGSGKWVKVSEPLFAVLQRARKAGKVSSGSFDITMSPVIRLWRAARKEKRLPDRDSVVAAMRKVGYKFIEIDNVKKAVRLKVAGMQLDLGGIAKGETAQRVYNSLRKSGFQFSLIDAGGDIVAGEVPTGIPAWRVAINLPESEELMDGQLLLRNKAVTTSGDLYQYMEVNGHRYSHIINPATGWALTNARNVTVIANDGATADWLTKACSILPIEKAIKLVKRFPGTEVQVAVLENNKPVFHWSPGFIKYFGQNKRELNSKW